MARSPFSLEGKTAIVTGGGTGIGKSIAIEFARAGADVALCSRKMEHLEPVVKEITGLGRRAFAEVVDVRQEEQVKGIESRIDFARSCTSDSDLHRMSDPAYEDRQVPSGCLTIGTIILPVMSPASITEFAL